MFFLFSIANKSTVFYQEKNDLISTIELLHVLKQQNYQLIFISAALFSKILDMDMGN